MFGSSLGDRKKYKESHPPPVKMPFSSVDVFLKLLGIVWGRTLGFFPKFRSLLPLKSPLTQPEENFPDFPKSVGHSVGQIFPTTKKGLRFYSKSLNFFGVPKRI